MDFHVHTQCAKVLQNIQCNNIIKRKNHPVINNPNASQQIKYICHLKCLLIKYYMISYALIIPNNNASLTLLLYY